MELPISDEILNRLERLSALADPPPRISVIEGRDQLAGDSFIQVGEGSDRRDDIYVSRDHSPAGAAELDVIAAARTYLPALIAEIRVLRSERRDRA